MTVMKMLGTSKVGAQNKITVIEPVAESLEIKTGDRIAFLKSTSGDIIIKNLCNIEMKDSEVK